jgi:hypothetical protein
MMVVGNNQMVYWKGSNVTIYEPDTEGKEQTRLLEVCRMAKEW